MNNKTSISIPHDAYVIARNNDYNAIGCVRDVGPSSGWILDNRGGKPRVSPVAGFNCVDDISDSFGTSFTRRINIETEGIITVETSLRATAKGVSLEFIDENDNLTYCLKHNGNGWGILGVDGAFTEVMECEINNDINFYFRISIDLDKSVSYTYINNVFCGTHKILSGSINAFRFASDKESKVAYFPGGFLMYANYSIFENFEKFSPLSCYGWTTGDGVSVECNEMWIDSDSAVKTINPIGNTVVLQSHFKCKSAKETAITLCCQDKPVVTIQYKDNTLFANGKELYKCRYNDIWHRLKLICDTNNGVCTVLFNGRNIGQADFEKTDFFDSVKFESKDGESNFDFLKLYNYLEHSDYVPSPLCSAKTDDYIVGMNICSMWVNGNHFGWSCISPFAEHEPYLGFYDEGNPETADWEIKYMVERGIDYQAFCWYGGFDNGYLKNPRLSDQIHEGFHYAKYSDKMYYTIMWETWDKVMTMEQFKTQTVPYWFENYFLDDRYLKIDNKIVFVVYAAQSLPMDRLFSSVENAKAALDYMDEEAKSYGYDGMIFLESGVFNNKTEEQLPVKAMGFDASICYHWFGDGYLAEHNITNISIAETQKPIHFIPTPSSGYDGYVWRKKTEDPVRRPVATHEDMYKVCSWIKNDYLPKYENESESWKKKMVMFSTWNEYGEGTFIMPCGINGFGQLNAIARAFPNGEKEDIIPTKSQRRRINRLYPQDLTQLRRYGYYVKDSIKGNEQSILAQYSPSYTKDNAVYYRHTGAGFNFSTASQLEIRLKGNIGTKVKISFTNAYETEFSDTKSFTLTIDSQDEKSYFINTRENYRFAKACFIQLKVEALGTEGLDDSFTPGNITVHSLIGSGSVAVNEALTINKRLIVSDIYPETDGQRIFYPFDPDTGIDYIINSLLSWSRYTGKLKLETTKHTLIFTVGSSLYTVDGVEKDLGYTLYLTDGIPMLDLIQLSDDLGFEYEKTENELIITVPETASMEKDLSDHDFVFSNGLTHNWQSDILIIHSYDTFMRAGRYLRTPTPYIYRYGTNFKAEDFNKLKLRVRFSYNRPVPNDLILYFDTDTNKGFCPERSIVVHHNVTDTQGEWVDYEVDLSENVFWKDTITNLRLLPYSGFGEIDFEYIRFVKE